VKNQQQQNKQTKQQNNNNKRSHCDIFLCVSGLAKRF